MKITLADIFNLTKSVIYNPKDYKSVTSVSIDTRTIKKNSLFVAIKGDKFDGHKFVADAIKNGASAVVINKRKLPEFDKINVPIITVPNTTIAYGELANIWRKKLNAIVISITGSNGKTTTKEILYSILSQKFKTEKSVQNNNNHIGVPLTILSTKPKCEVLILEHGTNHFNEIKYTAQIASPDLALITNIGDSHLEYLIDRKGVFKEKSALFSSTIENNGKLFINNDDKIIRQNSPRNGPKITYGFQGKCDVKGRIIGYTDDGRTKLEVAYKNKNLKVSLPIYGKSNTSNTIAAIAVAWYLKLTLKEIKSGVANINQIKGRLFVQLFNNFTLIDDTYNSNPSSMEAAIFLLNKIKTQRKKTLIIGDMFELGKNSIELHKALSTIIIKGSIDSVYTIGKMMKSLSEELKNSKINSIHFFSRRTLKSFINGHNFTDHVILVKGSRGMKMEEFVDQIRGKAA